MPDKFLADRASVHRSQLLNEPGAKKVSEVANFYESTLATSGGDQQPTQQTSGVGRAVTNLFRNLLRRIYCKDNFCRWELALVQPWTLVPNQYNVVPFDVERIVGQGVRYSTVSGWSFSPPPMYAGAYRLDAYLEFSALAGHNLLVARLEAWVSRKGAPAQLWGIIDKTPINHDNNDIGGAYIEQVILDNGCQVWLDCGDVLTLRCFTVSGANIMLATGTSCYGWVDLNFVGNNGALVTATPVTPYIMPHNL